MIVRIAITILGLISPLVAGAECPSAWSANSESGRQLKQAVLEISSAKQAEISVCPSVVLRTEVPETLFGFNINHWHFERDLFDASTGGIPAKVTDALKEFPGALYRFPGGLVANRFSWEASVGPVTQREPLRSVQWSPPAKLMFGVDDYLALVDQVGGQPWYVLNLMGWDYQGLFTELDKDYVAQSNGRLAAHMLEKIGTDKPRYYQLGNELDRADYQWSHAKYIEHSRRSIDAIKLADPDARFVAFLREFNWKYRGSEQSRSMSKSSDFVRDVLTGLPEVNDFSLHFYYDARGGKEIHKFLPYRIKEFRKAIDYATDVREGKSPGVWITEHARGIQFGEVKAVEALPYTGNLSAAVSTGDFLIALAQMPEVQGASWHGLNSMPWKLFDDAADLRPNAVYWAMRVLRKVSMQRVLATFNSSPNNSAYAGGYDVRAVVFANATDDILGVWAANRASATTVTTLHMPTWANRKIELRHYYAAGEEGADPDQPDLQPRIQLESEPVTMRFDANGRLQLQLPPASVSSFSLTRL